MSKKIKTAIEYIHEIKKVLSQNESISKFFSTTIEALQERETKWSGDEILIGMIGVTSAGKSSVLNAMLGEKILPVRVKPSSGVLVWCTKSDKREAIIRFHSYDPITLIKDKLTPENIAEFADESKNPGNHKSVDTIDVFHPKFMFDKGITIIDSPGLDAEGHDQHEVATLVRLLPLLDICILVIPIKPNSDKMFVEYIRKAVDANKPIIIVENMKDAVEATKKPDGTIHHSIDDVLEQHLARITRNIKDAGIDPAKVNILQVSAIEAMNSRLFDDDNLFIKSGFGKLKELILKFISDRKPMMDRSRLHSLNQYLKDRAIEEDKKISDFHSRSSKKKSQSAPKELKNKSEELSSMLDSIIDNTNKAQKHLDKSINEVDNLSNSDVEGAKSLIVKYRNKLTSIEKDIDKEIENVENSLSYLLDKLSMSLADYKAMKISLTEYPEQVPNITSSRTVHERVKQSGFWGGAKRLFSFGLAGYDNIEYTVHELKYGEIKDALRSLHSRHMQRFQSIINKWISSRKSAFQDIKKEVNRYSADYERRQNQVEQEKEILNIFEKLKDINDEIFSIITNSKKSSPDVLVNIAKTKTAQSIYPIQVNMPTLWIHSLTENFIHKQLNYVLQSIRGIESASKIIIAGWNEEMLASFVQKFYNVLIEASTLTGGTSGCSIFQLGNKTLHILNLRVCSEKEQSNAIKLLKEDAAKLILLVNVQQFGNTMSQLNASEFVTSLSKNQLPILSVMESIIEGNNSHSLSEFVIAFDDIVQYLVRRKIKIMGAIVNNSNALYSKLLNGIYNDLSSSLSKRLLSIDKIISENRVFIKGNVSKDLINDFSMGLRNLSKE